MRDFSIAILLALSYIAIFATGLVVGGDIGTNMGEQKAYIKLLGKREGERFLRCHSKGGEMVDTNAGTICLLKNKE